MSVPTLAMSSIAITKKKLSAYFLSHPCKMMVVYWVITQYLHTNAGVLPRKGHDSFLFSPLQFTGKTELHLTHTMPCQVWMTVPKCTLFCVLESPHTTLYHHTVTPSFQPNFSRHGTQMGGGCLFRIIQRVLYITLWQGMA
jgi:hypothetical protein